MPRAPFRLLRAGPSWAPITIPWGVYRSEVLGQDVVRPEGGGEPFAVGFEGLVVQLSDRVEHGLECRFEEVRELVDVVLVEDDGVGLPTLGAAHDHLPRALVHACLLY